MELFDAVHKGDYSKVVELIESGEFGVDERDLDYRTALRIPSRKRA